MIIVGTLQLWHNHIFQWILHRIYNNGTTEKPKTRLYHLLFQMLHAVNSFIWTLRMVEYKVCYVPFKMKVPF